MNLASAGTEPLPPVRMYFNPPSPLPKQGLHDVMVRFDGDQVDTVQVRRGSVTYFTKSTNWDWTSDDRAAEPDFSRRLDQVAPQLARAVRELQQAPQGGDGDGQQNNEFTIRLGEFPGAEQHYAGRLIGGRDAGDAVATLLRQLVDAAKDTLPSYTNGPG